MKKLKQSILVLIQLYICVNVGVAWSAQLTVLDNLISLDSEKGAHIFELAPLKNDYWKLSNLFITQKNTSCCGIANIVMLLNIFDLTAPDDENFLPYNFFTQENIFQTKQMSNVKNEAIVKKGLTLSQLETILSNFNLNANKHHADQLSYRKFKKLIVDSLKDKYSYVIANYCRELLGEKGCGHFSPIAAYSPKFDMFLILDVARYKYPPIWVKSRELWGAIHSKDQVSKEYRGLLIVSGKLS